MITKTANVKLDWQPSEFGGPETIYADIMPSLASKGIDGLQCPSL